MTPRVLTFDVFGTVLDWRRGIARRSAPFLAAIGRSDIDPAGFADDWRARYQPAMAAVRDGERSFVVLDILHREMLEAALLAHDVDVSALDCLVAAHHSDLAAARRSGLLTAYVDWPMERGGAAAPDHDQREDWDWSSGSLTDLATQLGC